MSSLFLRGNATTCAAFLASGLVLAPAAAAQAGQTQSGEIVAPPEAEIVVTAPVDLWGKALEPPVSTIGAAGIERMAADTIDDLLGRLPAAAGSDQPVVLVNGARADGIGIGSYPPEAIERIEVMSPQVAAQYGYEPGRKLLNIVLKRRFDRAIVLANARSATQGGGGEYGASVDHIRLTGKARRRVRLEFALGDRLLEVDRTIPVRSPAYSLDGLIRSAIPGNEIDPALTSLAGFSVTRAHLRGGAGTPLTLSDFVPVTDGPVQLDDSAYRTILPSTRSAILTTELTAPMGNFNSSLKLQAGYRRSTRLLGLSTASLLIPASNPFSPFARDIILDRAWDGSGALAGRERHLGASAVAALIGGAGGWQLGISTSYRVGFSRSHIDLGPDLGETDAAITAGAVDLFALGAPTILADGRNTTVQTAQISANASRKLMTLPAGPVNLALTGEAIATRSDMSPSGDKPGRIAGRASVTGSTAFTLPLNSSSQGLFRALGRVALQLTAGGGAARDERARVQLGYGLHWEPHTLIQLNLSEQVATTPPMTDVLTEPLVETPNVRSFDFVAGERVDVVRITGGNPGLRNATEKSLNLGASLTLPSLGGLTIGTKFRRDKIRNAIGQLPAPTAAVERAFPDRFLRNDGGTLVRIDARPINIAHALTKSLETSLTWVSGASGDDEEEELANDVGASDMQLGMTLHFYHRWNMADRVVLREGLPLLDRLAGDGGMSAARHNVSLMTDFTFGKMAGVQVTTRKASGTVARSESTEEAPGSRIDFSGKAEVDLRLYTNFGAFEKAKWAKNLRLVLDVANLFDSRVSATDQNGNVPFGFTRDELDPLGQTVRLTLRKML